MNNRKNYDWFKGQNSGGEKNTKEKLKVTWKFTRIFLMFSIFFFSMWGCVQVFTHKTSPVPGQGVEIVQKNQYNPLRVSVSVDQDANGVYSVTRPTHNNKVYSKDDLLPSINSWAKEQMGISDLTRNTGNKEWNVVVRLENKGVAANGGKIFDGVSKEKPLMYSTMQKTPAQGYVDDFSKAPKITYYYAEEDPKNDKNVIIKEAPTKIDFVAIYKSLPKGSNQDEINRAIVAYNLAVLQQMMTNIKTSTGKNIFDWFIDKKNHPQLKVSIPKEGTKYKDFIKYQSNIERIFGKQGIGVLGFEVVKNSKNVITDIKITPTAIPFSASGTSNSKIIATWKDAWQIGFGPFYGIFVYPISYVVNEMLGTFGFLSGWEAFIAILLTVITVSIFMFALSFKGLLQQTKMQELTAKKAVIDAKYAPYKGNKQMEMRQKQEVAGLYKKEGISPLGSLSSTLITMPFFLAMWRVIGSNQHIKSTTWLGLNFSATSYKEFLGNLSSGTGWIYFTLMLITVVTSLLAQLFPKLLTRRRDKTRINVQQKQAMKKGNRTQNIVMIISAFIGLIMSAGVQVYFIIRSLWRMVEGLITHHILIWRKKNKIQNKIK